MNANEQRPQAVSPASFSHQGYAAPYAATTPMSASMSPPITNATQYTYPQMMSQSRSSPEEAQNTPGQSAQSRHTPSTSTAQQVPQQAYQAQGQVSGYTNPYTYANNSIYGNMYAQQGAQGYASQYGGHNNPNAGPQNNYAGYQNAMPTAQISRNMSPQLQYNYSQNNNHGQYLGHNPVSQYQRPEDALQRMNGNGQPWSAYQYNALPPQSHNLHHAPYPQANNGYAQQWQPQQQQQQQPTVGQTVYYSMDNKPVQISSKPQPKPSSPPRPKVRHVLIAW